MTKGSNGANGAPAAAKKPDRSTTVYLAQCSQDMRSSREKLQAEHAGGSILGP